MMKEVADAIMSSEGPGVVVINTAIEGIDLLRSELVEYGVHVIWVDRKHDIHNKMDVFDAFDVALRFYWDCYYHWDVLTDMLYDPLYLPSQGCLLYFSSLNELSKVDSESYRILLNILSGLCVHWRERGYLFKSLVVSPESE